MGIVSERRRKQRAARMRRRLMIGAGVLLLGALAMSPQLRRQLDGAMSIAPVFGGSAQAELTLPARTIYALQLGVYDSGERAASQAKRLLEEGVLCVVWQREKMRIVADAALSRDALDMAAARGQEAYVISDALEEVSLRLTADDSEIADAQRLLETPDSTFLRLLGDDALETIVSDVQTLAKAAQAAHPENALHTQLAQSLMNWCTLMEKTLAENDAQSARSYARLTMCTLCRELRRTLGNEPAAPQAESEASTASAQRTPSTAADVMPPA